MRGERGRGGAARQERGAGGQGQGIGAKGRERAMWKRRRIFGVRVYCGFLDGSKAKYISSRV